MCRHGSEEGTYFQAPKQLDWVLYLPWVYLRHETTLFRILPKDWTLQSCSGFEPNLEISTCSLRQTAPFSTAPKWSARFNPTKLIHVCYAIKFANEVLHTQVNSFSIVVSKYHQIIILSWTLSVLSTYHDDFDILGDWVWVSTYHDDFDILGDWVGMSTYHDDFDNLGDWVGMSTYHDDFDILGDWVRMLLSLFLIE